MNTSIVPVHDDAYSCLEDLIYSLCVWKDNDFHAMFASSWNFDLDPFDSKSPLSLAKRIGTGNKEWDKLLSIYHGVKISDQQNRFSAKELLQRIKDRSLELPLIIAFDYYYCPWSKEFYYKYHGGGGGLSHTILLSSIENEGFMCIDPLFSTNVEYLPFNHFIKGYEGYRTVSFTKNIYTEIDCNWLEVTRYGVNKSLTSKFFDQLTTLTKEISNLDLVLESKGFEDRPGLSPIMYQLKLIGMGRKKFSKLLYRTYLQTRNEKFNILSKEVHKLGTDWDYLSNLMMKVFYTKHPERVLKKLVAKINEIRIQEEDKLAEISSCISKNLISKG
ncbi:hypothetical protein [Jeotgalibacillus proteolyticus]|uniref:Butirosin biosynthesis protein H N-terminal domain-containing protein n=1 Tax=Jeotgalibacillus proteolyticus TaxID=2082395 RepID=A0A2S5G706_9BACL|nr:hypothetical protein [Jeotgalibacillus proteolyticus]PPA68714.1 hypothetical protein C4B60_19280 [Jeotgalibacillus proteolyticus]PPA68791.1 hypothetical protein C4B60_19710 [Jeotgalibacillus proteolyticus]